MKKSHDIPRGNIRRGTIRRGDGSEAGIALMVVMVVFIILYLVVFQLHYTTRLGEKLSKSRAADSQGSSAIRSVAFSIMGMLVDDLEKGNQNSSGQSAPAGGGAAEPPPGPPAGPATDAAKRPVGVASSAGTDPTSLGADAGGGGGGPSWTDYIHKDIFLDNQQSLDNITVKISMVDNERAFDLNQLWSYAPSKAETLSQTNDEKAQKSLGDALSGTPGGQMVGSLLSKSDTQKTSSSKTASPKSSPGSNGQGSGQPATEAEAETSTQEWTPPTEERRQETVKMLQRAIDLMYRLNTEYGFDYKVQPPPAQNLADAIERYVYQRRSQPFQSYIHLPSELLNVLAMLGGSPEVYYGPVPDLHPGDEFTDRSQNFRYQKDEFGDLLGEYVYAEDLSAQREQMKDQLSQLQSVYGQFVSLPPELGLGRMGNPLTRNARELSEVEDEKGNTSLAVPPAPIGLKDIFCTFSSGKININTAPVPVLYALLALIIETEQDGELKAQGIALNIEHYRNSYQPEYDESDPTSAEAKTATAGAPHRQPQPRDGAAAAGAAALGKAGAKGSSQITDLLKSGASGQAGLSAQDLASAVEGGGSTDYQTNYFTNLSQLKLIDGEDGGRDDYLTDKGSATTTETLERKTPLQKVMHDYGQVMVFGSTYFTATLKSKAEDSPKVKVGYLTVVRDVKQRRMEVVQWKELQR